jgi:hypothetical protein
MQQACIEAVDTTCVQQTHMLLALCGTIAVLYSATALLRGTHHLQVTFKVAEVQMLHPRAAGSAANSAIYIMLSPARPEEQG